MLNQVVLVGRIANEPEIKDTENNRLLNITLAVPRAYKSKDGSYDTDFINCILWKGVAESTAEYCQKGDMVGVKGRLQQSNYEDKDGNKKVQLQVVAEKVTFLSTKAPKEHETAERDEGR